MGKVGGKGGGKRERVKRNLSPIPSSNFPSPRPPIRSYRFWHLRRRLGWWNAGGNLVNCSLGLTPLQSSFIISEFTEQDGRKKRMTKLLSVTNVMGLLLACFVGNSLNIDVFCSSTKRSVQRNVKFCGRFFQTKLLSRLSHKVCRRLSSPVLLRKFTTFERYNVTVGSLSNSVFERRTSTGSGLFAALGSGLVETLG